MGSIDGVSAAVGEFGIVSTDRDAEMIHVQVDSSDWAEVEAVAAQYGWTVSDRSEPRQQLTLEPDAEADG